MKKAILFIYFITFYFISPAQDEWALISPYPTLNNLIDAHFISEQKGWVVGVEGTIMVTEDGGDTWETQHSNPDESFWSVFFIDDNEGWTVGWSSIYHTTNAGVTWEKQTRPDVMGDLTDVYFINHDTGWIVGTYKIVLKTTNGGETWTKIMNQIYGDKSFYNVAFTDELNGCAVGGEMSGIYEGFTMVTNDGGITWTDTSPPDCNNLNAVEFIDSNTGWACGINRSLIKTTDGGNTWEHRDENYFYSTFNDIHFFDDSTGMLFGNGMVRLTFDAGNTWDSIVPFENYMYMNKFSSWGDGGVAVGWAGAISKTFDGGNTWEKMNKGLSQPVYEIGFFNPLDGFAISGYYWLRGLLRSTDGGNTWSNDTVIENGPFYKLRITGASCYLLNNNSQIMKSTNAGENWELFDIPDDTSYYNDIQFINENTGYMCSGDGIFVKTIDGGLTWTDKSFVNDYDLRSMFFINETKGWLIDYTGKTIIRTENGGDSWSFITLDADSVFQPMSIFFVNENKGYVTTAEGVIFSTLNGGEIWEEFYVFSSGSGSKIYFHNETEGWYSSGNTIYHTRDGGITWTNDQSLGATIYYLFFNDNQQGWISGASGLVATYNSSVDINEFHSSNISVFVFPNPAYNEVNVKLHEETDKIIDIKIFNLQGQKVKHFPNLSLANSFKFNVSDLTSGAYIVNVTSTNSINLVKLIVK